MSFERMSLVLGLVSYIFILAFVFLSQFSTLLVACVQIAYVWEAHISDFAYIFLASVYVACI